MKTTLWRRLLAGVKVGGKSGAILGMVLVIVVALSLVGIGLLQMGQMNAVEVSRSYNLSKAFWTAESGLFHARARLLGDTSYRNGSFPTVFISTGSDYRVWVSNPSNDFVNFTIVSTGMVQGATQVVAQSVLIIVQNGMPSAFNYALFGGTNDLLIKKASSFNGPVFVNGDISYTPPLTMTNGTMYETLTGTVDVVVGGGSIPDPAPASPVLYTNDFQNLINTAKSIGSTVLTNDIVLSGTNYYKGNVSLLGVTGVGGGATMVVGGSVTIDANSALTNRIRIIAGGDVTIGRNLAATAPIFVYSTGNVSFSANVSINSATIFAGGNITSDKTVVLTGILFANGAIDFKKDTTVTGSVVSVSGYYGGNSKVDKGFNITWDTNAFKFMDIMTNNFASPPPQVHANQDWQQLF